MLDVVGELLFLLLPSLALLWLLRLEVPISHSSLKAIPGGAGGGFGLDGGRGNAGGFVVDIQRHAVGS